MTAPTATRTLKAKMAMKGLSLKRVAQQARVNYSVACSVLNGKRISEESLRKLAKVIENH